MKFDTEAGNTEVCRIIRDPVSSIDLREVSNGRSTDFSTNKSPDEGGSVICALDSMAKAMEDAVNHVDSLLAGIARDKKGGSQDLAALRAENERLAAALQEEKDARAKEQQRLKEKIGQKFDQMKAEHSTTVEALNKELEEAKREAEEARRKLAEQEHSEGAHPQTNGSGRSDHAKEEEIVQLKVKLAQLEEDLTAVEHQKAASIQEVVAKAKEKSQTLISKNQELEARVQEAEALSAQLQQAQEKLLQLSEAEAEKEALQQQLAVLRAEAEAAKADVNTATETGAAAREAVQQAWFRLQDGWAKLSQAQERHAHAQAEAETMAASMMAKEQHRLARRVDDEPLAEDLRLVIKVQLRHVEHVVADVVDHLEDAPLRKRITFLKKAGDELTGEINKFCRIVVACFKALKRQVAGECDTSEGSSSCSCSGSSSESSPEEEGSKEDDDQSGSISEDSRNMDEVASELN